jgi:general secretion pathway protein K
MTGNSKQTGVALITVLMVVVLAGIVTVAMASQQVLDIRRTSNLVLYQQAYRNALGAETWLKQLLLRDAAANNYDTRNDDWAAARGGIQIEHGELLLDVEDLQGRFNLNNLVKEGQPDARSLKRLRRLLIRLELDPGFAEAVLDWVDNDSRATYPTGAEDEDYLGQEPPYRAANTLMVSPSELLLIKGMTLEAYRRLAPFVATLPVRTALNVNTASVEVLSAWLDELPPEQAEQVAQSRPAEGYQDIKQFSEHELLQGITIKDISVASDHFLVSIDSRFEDSRMQLVSLLQRQEKQVQTLMRTREGY